MAPGCRDLIELVKPTPCENLLAPLSGRLAPRTNPGLKPWAQSYCPFGARPIGP